MAKVIYKYEIPLMPEPAVNMPNDLQIISFQMQGNKMFVWVICDPLAESICYKFRLVATGGETPVLCDYIGTVVDHEYMVWHLFIDVLETEILLRNND